MNGHLLRAALAATECGWQVFPLHPGSKIPALHVEKTCTRTAMVRRGRHGLSTG
ncbi:hypothetical protein [Streptomyces cyaneogriseus]|uniref:hypothetical protein n=1 Tax=Streptomyces cyaneogriseus TaxID=68192 RepID=UPI000B18AD4E